MNIQLPTANKDYSKYEPIDTGLILSIPREDVNAMVATEGGILVPMGQDRINNPLQEMIVVAAGPGCKQIHKNDLVLFNIHNAPATPEGDLEYRFTQESHVLCITNKASDSTKQCVCD